MARSVTELYGNPPPGIDLQANQEVLDDSVVAVLATIATLAVAFRIIVKKRKRVGLDGDDWFILMALLGEYGTAACTLTSNYFGAGKHVWATNTPSLRKMSIALFIYPWIYVVATVGLKLSFCWTYMRIFSLSSVRGTIRCRTWIDRSLVACALASCMYALSVWLPMTVACRPLRHFWDQYTGASNGSCMDYLSMWIFTGICSAALDLIILLLPIPWIWSLQMSWTKKLSVMGILALGTLVVIAAIIRLVYMSRMMHETDITWALGPAQIWTSLEPSLGIVSPCLITTFRPMMSGIRSSIAVKQTSCPVTLDKRMAEELPARFHVSDGRTKKGMEKKNWKNWSFVTWAGDTKLSTSLWHFCRPTTDAKRPAAVATAILEYRTMPKPVKRANTPPLGVKAPYLVLWKLAATEPQLSQPLYASKQSTLFKFTSNTPRPRLFAPQSQIESIFVEGNNSESDDSASDVDQPLFPPSKRRRLTSTTPSNHIDDSESTSIQRSRKLAPTRGDSEELWSHARARRPGERERERKKKIWYCFYGNRDCPRNYSTTNYDNIRSHLKKRHGWRQATEQLKALLATSRSLIHFTCDAWTANYGNHELLSITARFVASDGKLSKALLALHKLSAGHAGAQCAPLFFDTIVTYGIEQKIGYITSDNATCNDTMMSHLATLFSERLSIDWDPIQHRTRCFGHQINLASQALMSASSTDTVAAVIDQSQDPSEAISTLAQGTGLTDHEALDYLRQFFEWIMRSPRRRREFKAAAGVSPMLNNTTRWNSWLAMIKRGIQSRATIRAIQSANEHMEHTTLQRRHWQFLEALVNFMEPLQEVTKLCEGDNATLDQVLISMDFLRKHYEIYT
ncbi:hypothetical protein KCU69_g4090, partial [Aureobasidium melanogenum]